jgi:hypothetical protein
MSLSQRLISLDDHRLHINSLALRLMSMDKLDKGDGRVDN